MTMPSVRFYTRNNTGFYHFFANHEAKWGLQFYPLIWHSVKIVHLRQGERVLQLRYQLSTRPPPSASSTPFFKVVGKAYKLYRKAFICLQNWNVGMEVRVHDQVSPSVCQEPLFDPCERSRQSVMDYWQKGLSSTVFTTMASGPLKDIITASVLDVSSAPCGITKGNKHIESARLHEKKTCNH